MGQSMPGVTVRRFLLLFVVFALLVAACGGDGDEADATATSAAAASADEETPTTSETTTESSAAPETTSGPETTEGAEPTSAPTDEDTEAFLSALTNASDPTSSRLEGSMTIVAPEGTPAGTEFAIEFSGAFDATGNSSMIMDMSGIADAAPPGEEIPAGMADLFGDMEIRTIGDTAFMKFGMFAMLGVETEWVSMPADEAGTTADSFGAAPANPMEMIDAFGDGSISVENLGSDTIRGVNTTHFRMTVDVEAMVAAADEEALAELEQLGPLGDGTLPIDFWIGDDGNVYRILMEFDGADIADSDFGSMTMVWEMYDFGADIEIPLPPADQVTDGSAIAGFLTG